MSAPCTDGWLWMGFTPWLCRLLSPLFSIQPLLRAKPYTFAKLYVLHMQNYMFCTRYILLHMQKHILLQNMYFCICKTICFALLMKNCIFWIKSDAHFMKRHLPLKLPLILFCFFAYKLHVAYYFEVYYVEEGVLGFKIISVQNLLCIRQRYAIDVYNYYIQHK